jgi:hypothetical protein
VGLFFSAKRVLAVIILAITGALPFFPLKESHYEVFLPMALKRSDLGWNIGIVSLASVRLITLYRRVNLDFFCSQTETNPCRKTSTVGTNNAVDS